MTDSKLSELSALYDGEVDRRDFRSTVDAMIHDARGMAVWQSYAMIGDHLRREHREMNDLTACIMARIADEPVVIAPHRMRAAESHHPLMALAASLAGISLVTWLAFSGQTLPSSATSHLAAVPPASTFRAVATVSHYPVHTVSQKAKKLNEKGMVVIGVPQSARNSQ